MPCLEWGCWFSSSQFFNNRINFSHFEVLTFDYFYFLLLCLQLFSIVSLSNMLYASVTVLSITIHCRISGVLAEFSPAICFSSCSFELRLLPRYAVELCSSRCWAFVSSKLFSPAFLVCGLNLVYYFRPSSDVWFEFSNRRPFRKVLYFRILSS